MPSDSGLQPATDLLTRYVRPLGITVHQVAASWGRRDEDVDEEEGRPLEPLALAEVPGGLPPQEPPAWEGPAEARSLVVATEAQQATELALAQAGLDPVPAAEAAAAPGRAEPTQSRAGRGGATLSPPVGAGAVGSAAGLAASVHRADASLSPGDVRRISAVASSTPARAQPAAPLGLALPAPEPEPLADEPDFFAGEPDDGPPEDASKKEPSASERAAEEERRDRAGQPKTVGPEPPKDPKADDSGGGGAAKGRTAALAGEVIGGAPRTGTPTAGPGAGSAGAGRRLGPQGGLPRRTAPSQAGVGAGGRLLVAGGARAGVRSPPLHPEQGARPVARPSPHPALGAGLDFVPQLSKAKAPAPLAGEVPAAPRPAEPHAQASRPETRPSTSGAPAPSAPAGSRADPLPPRAGLGGPGARAPRMPPWAGPGGAGATQVAASGAPGGGRDAGRVQVAGRFELPAGRAGGGGGGGRPGDGAAGAAAPVARPPQAEGASKPGRQESKELALLGALREAQGRAAYEAVDGEQVRADSERSAALGAQIGKLDEALRQEQQARAAQGDQDAFTPEKHPEQRKLVAERAPLLTEKQRLDARAGRARGRQSRAREQVEQGLEEQAQAAAGGRAGLLDRARRKAEQLSPRGAADLLARLEQGVWRREERDRRSQRRQHRDPEERDRWEGLEDARERARDTSRKAVLDAKQEAHEAASRDVDRLEAELREPGLGAKEQAGLRRKLAEARAAERSLRLTASERRSLRALERRAQARLEREQAREKRAEARTRRAGGAPPAGPPAAAPAAPAGSRRTFVAPPGAVAPPAPPPPPVPPAITPPAGPWAPTQPRGAEAAAGAAAGAGCSGCRCEPACPPGWTCRCLPGQGAAARRPDPAGGGATGPGATPRPGTPPPQKPEGGGGGARAPEGLSADPGPAARLRGVPVEQTPSYQEILEEERRLPPLTATPFRARARPYAARQPEATATVQTEGPCFERVPRAQVEAALEAARSQLADAEQVLRVAERGRQQAGSATVSGRLGYLADLARLVGSAAESRVHALEQVLAGQVSWMSGCDEYVARLVSGGARLETRVRVVSALLGAELLVASKSGLNLLALWGLLPTNAVGLITGMLHVLRVGDLHDRLLRLLQEAKEQLFGSDPERFEAHVAEEVGGLQKAGSAWDTAALLVGLASIGVAGYASSSRMGRGGPLKGPRVRAKPSGGGGARGQQPRPAPKVPAAPEGSPASGAPKGRTAKPDGAGHPPPAAPRGGSSAPRPAAPAGHGPSVQAGPSAPAKLPPPRTPAAPPGSVGSPSVGTPPSPPAQLPAGAPTQAGVRPAVPGVPAAPPPAPPRSPAGAAPPPPKPPAAAAPAAPPPKTREPRGPGGMDGGRGKRAGKRTGGGWRPGDPIDAPTRTGEPPAWSTQRERYWKNEAAGAESKQRWGERNVERMKEGLAPQRINPTTGEIESMELSHEPIPRREGGSQVVPRWPEDHAAVDPFRRLKKR